MVWLKVLLIQNDRSSIWCFNSKMVWLKVAIFAVVPLPIKFQFQNGLIKSLNVWTILILVSVFQFQNGLIKRMFNQELYRLYNKFQFQNGLIKRIQVVACADNKLMFQFQNGLIKSAVSWFTILFFVGFNSKMVWLKEYLLAHDTFLLFVSIPKWSD